MHTAVSFLLAGPRPGCDGFLAPRGVMGSAVRLATDSPSRGGIDDAAGQKDCSCPKDSWPTGCDRKQGLPAAYELGSHRRRVSAGGPRFAVPPTMPTSPTSWFYQMGEPGDPAAFYLIVVGDHRRRPRGRRRCKTGSCPRIPSRAGQPIAIIEAAGGRLSDGPFSRAGEESGIHQRQNHRDCSLAKS